MARALVTGATGFIGYHIARVLTEKGFDVRALVRAGSCTAPLAGLHIEPAPGDLRDYDSLRTAAKGCDCVYHAAADYRLWVPDPETMYATNVQGTINVMRAAFERNIEKIVYTSTVGVLAPAEGEKPGNESSRARLQDLAGHYKKSKFLAEREVRRFVEKGLPVVIVNPTAPIGAMDRKPTPTGKTIVDFLNGKIPAYLDTGLNFVDVEDVAEAHVLAATQRRRSAKATCWEMRISTLKAIPGASGPPGGKESRRAVETPLRAGPSASPLSTRDLFQAPAQKRQPTIPLDGVRMAAQLYVFRLLQGGADAWA